MAKLILDEYIALDKTSFWGPIHECGRCRREIQWCHSDRYPGGREVFTVSSGKPHRCRRSRRWGSVSKKHYTQRIRRPRL